MNSERAIRTERLQFREITEQDTEQIVKWRSQPDVYQYFKSPHALTVEDHLEWYRNKYLTDDCVISWMALRDSIPVGIFNAGRLNETTGEVSYLVAPEHQKKGYASEALRYMETWMKDNWGVVCLIAEIHRENVSSIRFIQSMGYNLYREEGMFEFYKKTSITFAN